MVSSIKWIIAIRKRMVYNMGIARDRDAPRQPNMTDAQRAEALAELLSQAEQLATEAERELYPFADHLADLIGDLMG